MPKLYLLKLGVLATAREEVLVKCVECGMAAKPGNIGKVETGIRMGFSLCLLCGIVINTIMNGV
jgi:hypothetical protein